MPNEVCGRVAAIYHFSINLIGLGCGTVTVALLSDALFPGPRGLGSAPLTIVLVLGPVSAGLLWTARRYFIAMTVESPT